MSLAQTTDTAPSSLSETYEQWTVRCVTPAVAEGAAPAAHICEMTQILSQRESGQQVLAVAMQPSTTGAELVFVAPFGLKLSAGLRVNIDDTPLLETLFHTCLPTGCIAKLDIPVTYVDVLAAGENATIIMVGANNGQEISMTISLAGFTAAWNRLKDLQG